MQVQPYLFFDGRCEEALEFYKNAIGAEVGMLMRFKDSPDKAMISPGAENKVMHAQFPGSTVSRSPSRPGPRLKPRRCSRPSATAVL
jgi:uncharacterized glyoxalase superfamily protein PhnB